jgi:c-di-AMP phosphodiesterase-like protein
LPFGYFLLFLQKYLLWKQKFVTDAMKSSATIKELQTFCKNILRYSPSYTKKEGIEVEDKEPLR